MDHPLVTVFVPSYNHSMYIIEALNSIKDQTYKNLQFIIIDDCSTDNSVEVIEKWINDRQVECTFIKHEVNQGICKTLNDVLKIAKGKYICSCTSDDVILPEKIERQVSLFETLSEDYGVIYSDAYLIKSNGERRFGFFIQMHRQFEDIPEGDIFDILIKGNFIPGMTAMTRRSVFDEIGLYDENLIFEDYDMLLRISKKYRFKFSDYISAKYRIHQKNLHKTILDWDKDYFWIYLKHAENKQAKNLLKQVVINSFINNKPYKRVLLKEYYNTVDDNSLKMFILKLPFPVLFYRIITKIQKLKLIITPN